MGRKICIHGHFYQPQRRDPWFGRIFLEPSAAPARHWNERITQESYAPLAWSRRLDADGRINELVNCYEWISFNFGPTLLLWMEREAPVLLERIQEADRLSLARWGHGNAMAQVFHHVILPLASPLDKKVEIAWALEDFQSRFQRDPEGLWLSECAADTDTLEAVAAQGIKFVLLSPHQARAVLTAQGESAPVDACSLDIGRPYAADLPSGRSLAIFFYQAELAQNVAFEGLLGDGERFWSRLSAAASALRGDNALLTLATDGETYGHHFTFGEMALAYALGQGCAGRDNMELTNFGAYLEANPPESRVILHNPSSWSCAHGVERWRGDCGCSTGGHEGWNQAWRGPLRRAADVLKKAVDAHYFAVGAEIFHDPEAALLDFGHVLSKETRAQSFMLKHVKDATRTRCAGELLRMQENAYAAFTSCAWFFDDISRIEPVNAMRFALRAMELMRASGGPELEAEFEAILAEAESNKQDEGNGLSVFRRRALPGRHDPAGLCLFAYLHACADGLLPEAGREVELRYPSLSVRLTPHSYAAAACAGRAVIANPESPDGVAYTWIGRLPLPGGAGPGISFVEAELELRPVSPNAEGGALKRCGKELARFLRDYLDTRLLEAALKARHEASLSVAMCLAANFQSPEEGQTACSAASRWTLIAPYLPLAVYCLPLSDEALPPLRALLDKLLAAPEVGRLAADLLGEAVLADLGPSGKDEAALLAALKRVKACFGGMDWWKAQNSLWSCGRVRPEFKTAAAELGFKV